MSLVRRGYGGKLSFIGRWFLSRYALSRASDQEPAFNPTRAHAEVQHGVPKVFV